MSKPAISSIGSNLSHLPLPIFSSIMGLSGLSIALRSMAVVWSSVGAMATIVAIVASLLFAIFLCLYILKAIRFPQEIAAELRHPMHRNFIATIPISLLLQASAYITVAPQLSLWLWVIGAVLQAAVTIYIVSSWIWGSTKLRDMTPTWYLPAVGSAVVPIAGVYYASVDISWYFLAVGAFLWVLLTVLLFTRLLTGELPQRIIRKTSYATTKK